MNQRFVWRHVLRNQYVFILSWASHLLMASTVAGEPFISTFDTKGISIGYATTPFCFRTRSMTSRYACFYMDVSKVNATVDYALLSAPWNLRVEAVFCQAIAILQGLQILYACPRNSA